MMHKTRRLLLIMTCLILLIPASGCDLSDVYEFIRPVVTPWGVKLQLEKAPRLNEPVELTCRVWTDYDIQNENISLRIERINPKTGRVVKVTPEDILVEGDFNWEAAVSKDSVKEFSAIVKFPHVGEWRISARTTPGIPRNYDGLSLYVAEDWGEIGPQRDYRPNAYPYSPNNLGYKDPMVDMDISRLPPVDETAELTWVINSPFWDEAEVEAEVEFFWMKGTDAVKVPAKDVLVKGDLTWEGNIMVDTPVRLSAIIKLPYEGDWEIHAQADSFVENNPIDGSFSLYLHAGKDKSWYGWAEPHDKPY